MPKTTVEIDDGLLGEAKEVAARERTTLRELVERGLRLLVSPRGTGEAFVLGDGSVPGNGLQPEFREAGWDRIREAVYEPDRA